MVHSSFIGWVEFFGVYMRDECIFGIRCHRHQLTPAPAMGFSWTHWTTTTTTKLIFLQAFTSLSHGVPSWGDSQYGGQCIHTSPSRSTRQQAKVSFIFTSARSGENHMLKWIESIYWTVYEFFERRYYDVKYGIQDCLGGYQLTLPEDQE